MEVYGDWGYIAPDFVMPENVIEPDYEAIIKEQEEKIRSLRLSNDVYEKSVEINKTISDGLMEQVCSDLVQQHNVSDPEDRLRLKNSLQLLSDWMIKGMEIHPSILAPEETKSVFPPVEKQSLPDALIALLTDGSNSTGE